MKLLNRPDNFLFAISNLIIYKELSATKTSCYFHYYDRDLINKLNINRPT